MKSIPTTITTREILALAEPGESHAVRAILTRVSNGGSARHKCKHRTYIFERDGAIGAHTLTIPASLWMEGSPQGAYRDNPSISHDLQPTAANGLIIQVIPFPGSVAAPAAPVVITHPVEGVGEKLELIDKLLGKLNAPSIMREALLAAMTETTAELAAFVDSVEVLESTDTPETDAQEMGETPATIEDTFAGLRVIGHEVFLGDEKVALFVDPDASLRMARGKTDLRPLVEAFLAKNHDPSVKTESLV